jgi:YidC/Oxa1 family membrane protein insertase
MTQLNTFLGINIAEAPGTMFATAFENKAFMGMLLAVIIPVMAGLTQFISVKLQPQQEMDPDSAMASSMKTMTYTMPLISVFMGFTLPAGLGLYWAVSALVRCIQQLLINRYLNKKSIQSLIEENQKKAAKRREKRGTKADTIQRMATTSTRHVEDRASSMSQAEKEQRIQASAQYASQAKPGSLTSKANMVRRFNSGQMEGQEKSE